jgi:hypothetical protein
VLVDEHGGLICEEARLGAALLLELNSIPVIVARRWSEEEKRAYRIADHQFWRRGQVRPPTCCATSCRRSTSPILIWA